MVECSEEPVSCLISLEFEVKAQSKDSLQKQAWDKLKEIANSPPSLY